MIEKSKYEKDYKTAPRFFMANDNDADLVPIKVPLPQPDNIREICGYGLKPEDQRFKRPDVPQRLQDLEEFPEDFIDPEVLKTTFILIAIQDFLKKNQKEWKEEIDFIEEQWRRRKEGYWFYNNGVPTYVTGTHYLYIGFWHIDIGIPDYRDRDRRFFVFWKTMVEEDENCLGLLYPKHRREGATHKAQAIIYDYVSQHKKSYGGIQSATEPHAKDVFTEHLIPGWKSLPFFFKPVWEGSTSPKKALVFKEPATRISISKTSLKSIKALGGMINFKSSDVKSYDSRKLHRYHADEIGKTSEVDIFDRHGTVRECVMNGNKIVGKILGTSTVEEQEKGGKEFKKLCDQSHYDHWDDEFKRTRNGRTISGMYILFIPAHDGFIVDEYGNSLIEESEESLRAKRQGFLDAGDFEGLSKEIRKYPMNYRECWRGDSQKCNFNIKILEDRIDELKFGTHKKSHKGNFKWLNDEPDTRVIWVPDEHGKFEMSYQLEKQLTNLQAIKSGVKVPNNLNAFAAGADPYKFKKTSSGKKSNGAGAVFMKRDLSIDGQEKDMDEWRTNRFACTYNFRPREKRIYGEDMLMMCVYYGCEINVEINVPYLWDYFEERGYGGYLWYGRDRRSGKINKKPGTNTLTAVIDDIYREYHTHIERHGGRECHQELLEQCLDIEDKMTDYDLFVAGGLALTSSKSFIDYKEAERKTDIGKYIQTYNY